VTTGPGNNDRRLPIALVVATGFEARIVERSRLKALAGTSCRFSDSDLAVVRVGVSCCAMDAGRLCETYSAIISIGFAGALAAGVKSGTVIEPRHIVTSDNESFPVDLALQQMVLVNNRQALVSGPLLHTSHLLASVADKQQGFESSQCIACDMESESSQCIACDMESGILASVARQSARPFACLRVVLDPADMPIPAPILSLSDQQSASQSESSVAAFLRAVLRHPAQLPATAVFLWHTRKAAKALAQAVEDLITGSAG